jgi:hypothetical protein
MNTSATIVDPSQKNFSWVVKGLRIFVAAVVGA